MSSNLNRFAYVNSPPLPVSEVVLEQIWLVQRVWRTADSRVQMGWLGWLLTNEPWACLFRLHSPVFAALVAFLHRLLSNRSSVGEEVRDKLKNIKKPFNWVSQNHRPRSFSIYDGNGSQYVTFKMNQRFFKRLCRVYSNSLKMSDVGKFPWSWFLRAALTLN